MIINFAQLQHFSSSFDAFREMVTIFLANKYFSNRNRFPSFFFEEKSSYL